MNVVKEIQRINELELGAGLSDSASWHAQYKDTAWIFAGNLDFELTEGDIVCIFSQYGELVNIELVRDKKTGKSMGFAFLQYQDQRSTILAVDNLGGSKVLGRTLRVDHSHGPRKRKHDDEEEDQDTTERHNIAPPMMMADTSTSSRPASSRVAAPDVDDEDPMASYFRDKKRKKEEKKKKKKRHHD
ncbi:hypothetical protein BC940DRAFT_293840 [Gongronella butleri]|nr:hypothetical protein BC940DRAFT_293840 [Gongronella butleri]